MPKKVLILANSSSGLYDFRNELILELRKKYQVSVSVPVESSDKDKCSALEEIGCQILPTDIDRRGLNPFVDGRLFLKYCGLLRREKSDLVITYTIKPNIYGALACRIRRKTCVIGDMVAIGDDICNLRQCGLRQKNDQCREQYANHYYPGEPVLLTCDKRGEKLQGNRPPSTNFHW
jgi:hypothetical protein